MTRTRVFWRQPSVIVAVLILACSAIGMSVGIRAYGIYLAKLPVFAPDNRTLNSIPAETPRWTKVGQDRIESADVVATLGTENYLSRTYVQRNPADPSRPQAIELHLAYYTGMVDTVPHVPDRCFIGGGMTQGTNPSVLPLAFDRSRWFPDPYASPDASQEVWRIRLADEPRFTSRPGQSVRLPFKPESTRMRIMGFDVPGGARVFAGYFFIANGGHVANAQDVRLLAFNLKDDYAYYLKVQCTSVTARSPEELAELSADLLGDLLGEIMLCVPDWIEVQEGRYPHDNPKRRAPTGA